MNIIKAIVNKFKNAIKEREGKEFNYRESKNSYVVFSKNVKKIKLRNLISELSSTLSELNYRPYLENRLMLIEEFEYKGVVGVYEACKKQNKIHKVNSKSKRIKT